MAIGSYQESGDGRWLDWAAELAADVLGRRIADESGVRWSNTEHRLDPPDLEPELGWMQGAAGIAAWLLRLTRVRSQGTGAPQLWWPDRPAPAVGAVDPTGAVGGPRLLITPSDRVHTPGQGIVMRWALSSADSSLGATPSLRR